MDKQHAPWLMLMLALAFPARLAAADGQPAFDKRPLLLRAMAREMQRSLHKLKMPGFDPPYFVAYEMKDASSHHIQARYGAVYKSSTDRSRRLRTEVRVGSYQFDSVGSKKSEYGFSFSPGYRVSTYGPLDDDPQSLRNSLWLMSDQEYKGALKSYLKRKSKLVTEVEEKEVADSFSREKPNDYTQPRGTLVFDQDRWEQVARTASSLFERHPAIFDSYVTTDAGHEVRYFVNSEGSRIITESTIYSVSIYGVTRAEDGMLLKSRRTLYARTQGGLPAEQSVLDETRALIGNLEALREAPVLEPYTGPAILDGEATGVLFHEVVGHRLEGERQLDEKEGKTFKGQVGKTIIPEFLTVIDDPTRRTVGDTGLNGFYRFDDEGVRARRVVLVDKGVLKGFLTSRTPIKGFPHSNGHGRASAGEEPRARMGNTMVISHRKVSFERLKEMLLEEVEKQGKPYGLIIKNIVGGSTHTSTWGYQAYKGIPELVYRVFPDGREELVRGVEIVGTPIASINKIIATSDRTAVFNGYCGAESGYIPVSASAPDVLMTEIELQRSMKKAEKEPILPSPWSAVPAKPAKPSR